MEESLCNQNVEQIASSIKQSFQSFDFLNPNTKQRVSGLPITNVQGCEAVAAFSSCEGFAFSHR